MVVCYNEKWRKIDVYLEASKAFQLGRRLGMGCDVDRHAAVVVLRKVSDSEGG